MTLQSRISWIVITSLATLFVGGELLNWEIPNSPGKNAPKTYDVASAPRAINVQEVGRLIGYPKRAVNAGIQGKVLLRVQIGENGQYVSHKVLQEDHPLLRMACEVYLPLLKFEPATKKGNPVPSFLDIPFVFSMN